MRGVRAAGRAMTFVLSITVVLLLTVTVGSTQLLDPARELVGVAASKLTSRQVGEPETAIESPESLAFLNDARPSGPINEPGKAVRLPPVPVLSGTEEADEESDGENDETAQLAIEETTTAPTEPRVPTGSDASRPAPAPATAPPTTATPATTTPATTGAPRTTAPPATTAAPTTTAPPATPAPRFVNGSAGHNGSVGCRRNCREVGYQNLDGTNNFVLENVIVSNPDGRCLTARNARNLTIRNVTFTNCGTNQGVRDGYGTGLVHIENASNVTIRDSKFENMAARHTGDMRNNALQIVESPDTRVVNNEFRNIHSDIGQKDGDRGNRSILVRGNNSHGLTIERNSFINPGRNALQIKQARDLRGVSFSNNRVEGRGPWDSDFEDMVNLYSSSGQANSPIVLRGNYLRNGGSSISGTAIIVGDGDANAGVSRHIVVERNVIVNPGHVGINLAGGDHITVRDNIIYGNQNVPHDTTVGLIVNHFGYSPECRDHIVTGNRVYMQNQHKSGGVNHVWIPGSCSQNVRIENNTFGDESLNGRVWNIG